MSPHMTTIPRWVLIALTLALMIETSSAWLTVVYGLALVAHCAAYLIAVTVKETTP